MYPSDLNDEEWALVGHFFDRSDPRGSRGKFEKRTIVNAILYVAKGGITWRMMPNDFPPWNTVYDHFRRWNRRGVWEQALDFLNREVRSKQGKKETPTYAIVDSQSVKTQYASQDRGIDGWKKVKGHKRHIATDTLGNMLEVQVHAANVYDTNKGWQVCEKVAKKYPTVEAFSADQSYRGTTLGFVENTLGLRLDISSKPKEGFQVVAKRWIVERTFAWLGAFRRLAKDFEMLTSTSENMIRIAMITITVAKCV